MDLLDILRASFIAPFNCQFYQRDRHLECTVGTLYSFVSKKRNFLLKDKQYRSNYGEKEHRKKFGMNGNIKLDKNNPLCITKMENQ